MIERTFLPFFYYLDADLSISQHPKLTFHVFPPLYSVNVDVNGKFLLLAPTLTV